jgi:hypothetical protein
VVDATSGRGGCDVACDGANRVGRDGRNQCRANYTFTSNGNEQRGQLDAGVIDATNRRVVDATAGVVGTTNGHD